MYLLLIYPEHLRLVPEDDFRFCQGYYRVFIMQAVSGLYRPWTSQRPARCKQHAPSIII